MLRDVLVKCEATDNTLICINIKGATGNACVFIPQSVGYALFRSVFPVNVFICENARESVYIGRIR